MRLTHGHPSHIFSNPLLLVLRRYTILYNRCLSTYCYRSTVISHTSHSWGLLPETFNSSLDTLKYNHNPPARSTVTSDASHHWGLLPVHSLECLSMETSYSETYVYSPESPYPQLSGTILQGTIGRIFRTMRPFLSFFHPLPLEWL